MKTLFRHSMKVLLLVLLLAGTIGTAMAQGAKLQLDQLDVLASRASETVDVKIDEHLVKIATDIFSKEKDDADIKDVLKGLKGIYVKSFTFEKEGAYTHTAVDSVLSQLSGSAWNKIVSVNSKKDGENVEVYLMKQGEQIEGLAVISVEPKEFTVVNIVGPINLEKLIKLEGQFGVPDLGLEKPKTKKSKLVP